MRLSAFNLYVDEYPAPGTTLVYNTYSGAFAEIPAEVLTILRRADKGQALRDDEQAQIDPAFFDEDCNILVESRAAEEADYRAYHERRRSETGELGVMISTTFACNFDCTYCCQNDVLNGKMMNASLGADTARWVADRALEIGAKKIDIVFVGGEPLLHPDRIEQLVADIGERTRHAGVEIVFSLLTNGLFMTRELVERWVPIGLRAAQVTLDGDETTHSITRRSKKKEDTFAAIFANVIACADLIRITVNGNYQSDTVHGFVPLIHKLREAGLNKDSRLRFSPAVTTLGAPTDSASGACTWSGSQPEYMMLFHDEIRRTGFDAPDPVVIGPCAFHQRHYYAVDPDGHIYKCPGFLGHQEWAIGHVTTGLTSRYDGLVNINPQRECGTCSHRPHCAGGCVAAEWMKVGRAEGVNCEIGFFEQHGSELIKRKYAVATNPDDPVTALAEFDSIPVPAPPVAVKHGAKVSLRVLAA